jgi:hypothetical protein
LLTKQKLFKMYTVSSSNEVGFMANKNIRNAIASAADITARVIAQTPVLIEAAKAYAQASNEVKKALRGAPAAVELVSREASASVKPTTTQESKPTHKP